MKKFSLISIIALGISACGHDAEPEAGVAVIDTQDQKVSYLMGIENGKGIGSTGIELDHAAYQQGFADGVDKLKSKLDEAETSKVIQAFQKQMMAKREEMQKAEQEARELESAANIEEGNAFLKANGAKEGVVTTESGLQYKIITTGTGISRVQIVLLKFTTPEDYWMEQSLIVPLNAAFPLSLASLK